MSAPRSTGRRGCDVENCERPHKGKGLCDLHRQRMRRTGTTDAPKTLTLAERFWPKVDRRGPDDCWEWTNATNEHGYGVLRPEGRRSGLALKAHRVSLELAGVQIEGLVVRHSCDNPPCVNPAHLLPGTQDDNMADRTERGGDPAGSRNGQSKLNEAQVAEIRKRAADGELHHVLAAEYGVSRSNVTRIVSKRGWKHVP